VFAIDRERFPRMMMTWHCYEVSKLISGATTWDDATIEQARRDNPQWARPSDRAEGANAASVEEFQAFAKDFGGLTYRESWRMWAKNEAWRLRAGIIFFADEQAEEGHDTGDLDDDILF
jgi:hypothetical protein